MIRYCRAYELARLREFTGFPADAAAGVRFVWDDYRVTEEPFADAEAVLAGTEPGWPAFCAQRLDFHPERDAR